jgi:hypothetical protein
MHNLPDHREYEKDGMEVMEQREPGRETEGVYYSGKGNGMRTDFVKVRYRRMGSKSDGPTVMDIDGVVSGTTIGLCPGSAYALRDALSAALDDYERDEKQASEKR